MTSGVRRVVGFCALSFLLFLNISAWAAPFNGLPYQVHRVRTPDGAELVLYEIMKDGGGDVIEFKLGFEQTAEAVDDRILKHVEAGDKVFIGQIRYAGRGENRSSGGKHNGHEQVFELDGPTLSREVIRRAGTRKVHGIGYSLGAVQYIAMASHSKHSTEFYPRIATLTLIAGPDDFVDLPRRVKIAAKVLLPVFRKIREASGKQTLEWTALLDYTHEMKKGGNTAVIASAHLIEAAGISFGNFVLQTILSDTKHMSPKARRRLWFKDTSSLPLDLLIGIAEAAVSKDGQFRDSRGHRLVRPEAVTVPTQVVRGSTDILAPMKQQQRLFDRLGSKIKRMITLFDMKHVTITHGDDASLTKMDEHIIDFIRDPKKAVRSNPQDLEMREPSLCARLLTALRLQFP